MCTEYSMSLASPMGEPLALALRYGGLDLD